MTDSSMTNSMTTTTDCLKFYIDGAWRDPVSADAPVTDVINPATEESIGRIRLGGAADVDVAVVAARTAFPAFAKTGRDERIALLERILTLFNQHTDRMAALINMEMGAPMDFARGSQAASGSAHLEEAIRVLKDYAFETTVGASQVLREPIGVCGFITPWNWPINQVMCKVAPALAAGCTVVLKPSEIAPLSACLLAEILHEAGVPKGVFNLVNGDGPGVGALLSAHPEVDMVSFTGSTRAGILVAQAAAATVKRVAQELGGKAPNIMLEDADFSRAVSGGVKACFRNAGQSCTAASRMLVPRSRHDEAVAIARDTAAEFTPGVAGPGEVGPVVSAAQYEKIQALINKGVEEGADLVIGGPGRPEGINRGYYIRPTVFANVSNDMTIAREEIFGTVLSIIPFEDDDDAVRIANDTPYGLSAYVSSGDRKRAERVGRRLRAGMVYLNGATTDIAAPFGGYRQSGNGREWGLYGMEEFLEVKAVAG